MGDFAVGGAALVAGVLEGALESLWSNLVGIKDLAVMVWDILKSLVTGNILNDGQNLWNQITGINWGDLAQAWLGNFQKKWNEPDLWKKWQFRGWVIGYAITEIALAVLTFGGVTGAKWAGKISTKAIQIIKEIPGVAKLAAQVSKITVPARIKKGLEQLRKIEIGKKTQPGKGSSLDSGLANRGYRPKPGERSISKIIKVDEMIAEYGQEGAKMLEQGIIGKAPALDGHQIKITADGRILRCSKCAVLEKVYKDSLDVNPELKAKLEAIQKREVNPKESKRAAKEAAKLEEEIVRQGIVKGLITYYPEKELLTTGKHGIHWTEGPARAKMSAASNTQGQFGSLEDVHFAVQKGATLGADNSKGAYFNLPEGHSSIVYTLKDGEVIIKPATKVWVKTYPEVKGKVKIHAYPTL